MNPATAEGGPVGRPFGTRKPARTPVRRAVMNNPWHRLPARSPFVLPEDAESVLAFNAKQCQRANQEHLLRLDLVPEPFVGRPDAPVVLLGNNPGVNSAESEADRRKPTFARRMRDNLLHRLPGAFPLAPPP